MSSFDPPLSRTTAALLVFAALLVAGWVFYAAYRTTTMKPAVSTVGIAVAP